MSLILFQRWKRKGTLGAFFIASASAGPILAGLAGSAAGLSAFVFVGGPGLFATVGIASLWLIASAPLTGTLQCIAVGEPILERLQKRRSLSIPALIADRFGEGWPRGLAALMIVIGSLATLAVQIKALAILGESLLPIPGWSLAAAAIALTLAYTATGGMRLGLPAEALQGAIMAVIAITLSFAGLHQAGGMIHIREILQSLPQELLDPMASGHGSRFLGLFLLFAIGTCAQPHYLQKFLMLKNRSTLRSLPLVSTISLVSILSIWIGFGLAGASLAARGRLQFTSPDALAPALLLELGGSILFPAAIVAILAAVMSTAATLLNLTAAAFALDFPMAFGRRPSTDARTLSRARSATLAAALIAGVLALGSGRGVISLGIFGWGLSTAGFLPVIVLGMRDEKIPRQAAVAALLGGPLIQLSLEALHSAHLLLSWQPGLSGAAAGVLILSLWPPASRGASQSLS